MDLYMRFGYYEKGKVVLAYSTQSTEFEDNNILVVDFETNESFELVIAWKRNRRNRKKDSKPINE
jgi:hypothetical protein